MTQYIKYPATGGDGVETYANEAALPSSADDGAVAVTLDTNTLWIYDTAQAQWDSVASPTTVFEIGTINSVAKSADGANITSNGLILQTADTSSPGYVSTGAQSFAGNKTFTGSISASNLSGTNTGDVTLGTAGSSPNGNAASLSGQILTLQPADGTNPGIVSTTTQTFAGNKTFSGTISASNFSGTHSGTSSGTNTGDVTLATFGSSPSSTGASLAGQVLTLQPADATNPGGVSTGTQTFAGNKTFSGTIAASNFSGAHSGTSSGTNTGDVTLAAVGSSANANGATLAGQVLNLEPASASFPGVVTTGTQTFAGAKTFSSAPTFSTMTAGSVLFAGTSGLLSQSNSNFFFDNSNTRLYIGSNSSGTARLNTVVTSGSSVSANFFSTGTNNCVQIQNQSSYTLSLTNAAASALAGASIGGAFSRGTLSSKAQSLSGDQIFSITGQGYTGSAVGPGFSGAISIQLSENTTATNNGAEIVLSPTPNGSLAPVESLRVTNSGAVRLSSLTASQAVFSDGSKNLVSYTAAQATAYMNNFVGDSGSGGTKGLVPAPASGDAAAGKYLDASGTWSVTPAATTNPYQITNLGLATSVAANELTISLKQADGSTDPSTGGASVRIGFRSSTITSGAYNVRSVTSSLSLTVSSGSTLGHQSGVDRYIYVYALDNAGTVALGVSSAHYNDGSIVTTTAEGGAGAADSNSAMYSASALTNVPCRLIGLLLSNQATAGTWASNMANVSVVPFEIPKIIAKYRAANGVSIDATQPLDAATKVFDTHGCVTTGASWKFTANKAGVYKLNAVVYVGGAVTTFVYLNGVQYDYLGATNSGNVFYSGNAMIAMAEDDYIDVRSDTPVATSSGVTYVEIEYLGEYL